MKLRDVMTSNVHLVDPDSTLRQAAEKMREYDVGPLPVLQNNRLIGILTDRDLAVRAIAEGRNPETTPVRDVMTPDVVCGFEDQDVEEAADLMARKQLRRLVVLDRNNRVAGIVSLGDLAVEAGDEQLAGHTLAAVSKPAQPA